MSISSRETWRIYLNYKMAELRSDNSSPPIIIIRISVFEFFKDLLQSLLCIEEPDAHSSICHSTGVLAGLNLPKECTQEAWLTVLRSTTIWWSRVPCQAPRAHRPTFHPAHPRRKFRLQKFLGSPILEGMLDVLLHTKGCNARENVFEWGPFEMYSLMIKLSADANESTHDLFHHKSTIGLDGDPPC